MGQLSDRLGLESIRLVQTNLVARVTPSGASRFRRPEWLAKARCHSAWWFARKTCSTARWCPSSCLGPSVTRNSSNLHPSTKRPAARDSSRTGRLRLWFRLAPTVASQLPEAQAGQAKAPLSSASWRLPTLQCPGAFWADLAFQL